MVGESTSAITLQQHFGWLAVFHLQMYVLVQVLSGDPMFLLLSGV